MAATLIDTSVWIAHLRSAHETLTELLKEGAVLTHPAVIGELACGSLKNRQEFLENLSRLKTVTESEPEEVMEFIERQKLYGKGIGWIDAQLLTSCLLSDCKILTLDKKLSKLAAKIL